MVFNLTDEERDEVFWADVTLATRLSLPVNNIVS